MAVSATSIAVERALPKGAGKLDTQTHTCLVTYTLASGATTGAPKVIAPNGCTHIESIFISSGATTASPTGAMSVVIKDDYDRDLMGGAGSAVPFNGNVVIPTPDGSQKFPAQVYNNVTIAPTGNTTSGADFVVGINFTK